MTDREAVIIGTVASAASTVIHAIGSVTCQIIRTWKQPVSARMPDKPKPTTEPK